MAVRMSVVAGLLGGLLVAPGAVRAEPGALTQLPGLDGCITETGSNMQCTDGKALRGANSVVISPDGKHVYAASLHSKAVAVLQREK
jgi:hypothetical protein